jgi:hypothetical protein
MTRRRAAVLGSLVVSLAVLALAAVAFGQGSGGSEVTVGSQDTEFSQNKQNEPWVAIDPSNPTHVAAGANDNIDLELCNAGDDTTCPFTVGVGVSGVSFSSNSGHSWTQPIYTGYSARFGEPNTATPTSCIGVPGPDPGCNPEEDGPIGTLPNYFENGLVSNGDPTLAFGPKPDGQGGFTFANGSRLYYANIATNFSAQRDEQAFKGFAAIAVSRTDDFDAAMAGVNSAWKDPVIVTKQNSALFSDKEALTADDAESSPFFGNVYVCNVAFRSIASAPEPVIVSRSTDGGDTWRSRQITAATNNNQTGGRQGCSIKTDSKGTVFVFFEGTDIITRGSAIFLARSFDGGQQFERPRIVARLTDCGLFDPATGRLSFDGVAGARTDSFPIADIANGAPTGAGATDEIVFTYCDGPTPSNTSPGANERAPILYSTNGGDTFTNGGSASLVTDRPDFPAVAIAADGSTLYVTYTNFLQPWQSSALTPPRLAQGVTRTASVAASGTPGSFADIDRAPTGDARGTSQNGLVAEFLGDYNFADATSDYGITVWNDMRQAPDCPAIDVYRQKLVDGTTPNPTPAPNEDCPTFWGNSDIWSFTTAP